MQCPKCSSQMETKQIEGIEVDQCSGCSGIWFDFDELKQVLEKDRQEALRNRIENNEGDDEQKASCPRCRGNGKMVAVVDPAHGIHIDTCAVCYGQWLDGGEYEKLKGTSILSIFRC